MNAILGKVSETGRLSLPAEFRRAIGLDKGGDVIVELDGREIRIRTLDEVIDTAQALTRQLLGGEATASVDDFLERRGPDMSEE